jgi:hypothetical protein
MTSTIDSTVLSVEQAARFTPEQIVELLRSHATLREEVSALKHQLEWFKRQLFGQKSERRIVESAPGQMSLGEALNPAQTGVAPEPKSRRIDAHTRRVTIGVGNGYRRPLPPNPVCGFPATGSPVSCFLIGIGAPRDGPQTS